MAVVKIDGAAISSCRFLNESRRWRLCWISRKHLVRTDNLSILRKLRNRLNYMAASCCTIEYESYSRTYGRTSSFEVILLC